MKTHAFLTIWFIYFIGAGAGLMVIGSIVGKDNWGLKNFGINYGIVFTAWGVGGFVMGRLSQMLIAGTGSYTSSSLTAAALLIIGADHTLTLKGRKNWGGYSKEGHFVLREIIKVTMRCATVVAQILLPEQGIHLMIKAALRFRKGKQMRKNVKREIELCPTHPNFSSTFSSASWSLINPHFQFILRGGMSAPQNLQGTNRYFLLWGTTWSLMHLGHVRLRLKIVLTTTLNNGFIDSLQGLY